MRRWSLSAGFGRTSFWEYIYPILESGDVSIIVEGLYHTYNPHTPLEVSALEDINLEIGDGEFVGIIGPTGSGKSTLIQHFNGLLLPTKGRVIVDGMEVGKKGANLREIRRRVGLVFQYPEHQLFEETVYKDVAFGPKNLGLDDEDVDFRVREAIKLVGLDESFLDRSPFELSGGQMRRVAMAGILAMDPGTLVLDEPTAGLDPRGRDAILGYIQGLHAKKGTTIILVSHNMEEIARLVERIYVMDRGRVVLMGSPREVFREEDLLRKIGLGIPHVAQLVRRLRAEGKPIRPDIVSLDEAEEEIVKMVGIS